MYMYLKTVALRFWFRICLDFSYLRSHDYELSLFVRIDNLFVRTNFKLSKQISYSSKQITYLSEQILIRPNCNLFVWTIFFFHPSLPRRHTQQTYFWCFKNYIATYIFHHKLTKFRLQVVFTYLIRKMESSLKLLRFQIKQ